MDTYQAFSQTVERFNLNVAEISRKTGISESSLSKFRNGKVDMSTKRFAKVLNAMPLSAQLFFFSLWTHPQLESDECCHAA